MRTKSNNATVLNKRASPATGALKQGRFRIT